MSLSPDSIVQQNTGTANSTTITCTLASGTTAGNTVILCVYTVGTGGPTCTGFTRDHGSSVGATKAYVLRQTAVDAGLTTFALNAFSGSQPTVWFAYELAGVHNLVPKEAGVTSPQSGTGVTSQTTGTTPATQAYQGLAWAFWGAHNPTNSTVPALSAFTNGLAQQSTNNRADGATATAATVALAVVSDLGTFESTAIISVSSNTSAMMIMYAAADSKRVPNLDVCSGFEWGTTAGHTTGNAGNPPLDFANGTVTYSTSTPRTGTYCLQLAGTAAAANAGWSSTGALGLHTVPTGFTDREYYVARLSFRFVGSLPGADVGLVFLDGGAEGSGSGLQVFFRQSTGKLGLRVRQTTNVGTEVLSATAIVADTTYDLDLLWDGANAQREQQWRGSWRLDDVDQTTATVTTDTASVKGVITSFRWGWTTSSTATLRIDDVAGSKHPGHWPLGSIKVYPLKVDPAATPTVTSATAFSTFTANGTINSTFSTTTARDAVDDIPPTIGASADGFVQDTIAASDYVELAMQTRDVYANLESLRGVRWYFCGWAVDATAATIGFRAYDGSAETTLFAAADPNFDASTTTPAWVCKMNRAQASSTPYDWTQTKLDALCARVGFSGDATPNIGVHAILAELAVRVGYEQQVVQVDGVLAYSILDPDTGNVIAMRLVAPGDSAAAAKYIINGGTVNRSATIASEDLYTVGAEANSVISFVSAERA